MCLERKFCGHGSLTFHFRRDTKHLVNPKPVIALVGSDAFLQLQALAQVSADLPPDATRLEIDGERAELSDLLDELRSFSMFGGDTKLVIVRSADEFISRFREAMEKYVANPSATAVLVLRMNAKLNKGHKISKLIAKHGQIVECMPPDQRRVPAWIQQRAKSAHQLAVTPKAAAQLAELIGTDLGKIDNELAKLALQCDDGKVDVEDIGRNISFQREQAMWDMTNAMATGQTTEALRRWRSMVQLDPSTEFRAVTWIGMWLEDVRKVLSAKRAGKNPQGVLANFKYPDPRLRAEFVRTAEAMGDTGAARALHLLTEIDKQSKSGVGDAAANVERFILDLSINR